MARVYNSSAVAFGITSQTVPSLYVLVAMMCYCLFCLRYEGALPKFIIFIISRKRSYSRSS